MVEKVCRELREKTEKESYTQKTLFSKTAAKLINAGVRGKSVCIDACLTARIVRYFTCDFSSCRRSVCRPSATVVLVLVQE